MFNLSEIPKFPKFPINLFDSKIMIRLKDVEVDNKTKKIVIKKSSLVSLFRIRELTCLCSNIQILPDLRNLRILICNGNNIEYIPDTLVNLVELHCYNNNKLKEISSLKNLRILYCDNCSLLTKIGSDSTSFPNLERLDCFSCFRLQEIGPMPKLKILDCKRNIQLVNISDQYSLEVLNCQRCYMLDFSKSKMPKLINIKCNYCFDLRLPENLPKLIVLKCVSCMSMKLNYYKSLEFIDCIGCPYFIFENNNICTVSNIHNYKEWCKKTNYIVVSFTLCLMNLRLLKEKKNPIIYRDVIIHKLKDMLI